MTQQVPVMEFGRRVALERELEKSDQTRLCNIVWDESSNFLLYGTLLGVKGEGNDKMVARLAVIKKETNLINHKLGESREVLPGTYYLSRFYLCFNPGLCCAAVAKYCVMG